jgi:hypothetical protein
MIRSAIRYSGKEGALGIDVVVVDDVVVLGTVVVVVVLVVVVIVVVGAGSFDDVHAVKISAAATNR